MANAQSAIDGTKADVDRTLFERRRQEALIATESATRQKLEQVVADEQRFRAQLASCAADLNTVIAQLASRQADLVYPPPERLPSHCGMPSCPTFCVAYRMLLLATICSAARYASA
jgi:hypothetical protein